jgi:type IV pilus assembly protein PilO
VPLLDKNNPKNTIIAGGVFFVAICIIFYSALYGPLVKKIGEQEKVLSEKQAKLEETKTIASQLESLEMQNRILEEELKESSKRLPQEKEIPDLLRKITNLGNKNHVDFIYFNPQTVVPRDFYKEVPIRVSVRSTYHNLGIFLSELGQLERIVNTSDIQIQPLGGKEGQTISSTFLITTFIFAEGGGI